MAVYRLISAASTNANLVSTTPGSVSLLQAVNNGAGWAYVKIYDEANAPAVGTDTPILTFGLPPNGGTAGPYDFAVAAGFAIAITGGLADNDTTAVAAAQVCANFTHS